MLADPLPVGAGGGLRAVQVAGPAGEALYLTQVDRPPAGFDLPEARGPVGPVFIAVLASGDLPVSRARLEDALGARRVTDHPLPVRAINAAMGLAAGTRHRVSSVQLAGRTAVEVDQYPSPAGPRSSDEGSIAGGIVAVSVRSGLAPAVEVVPAAGGALLEHLA